MSSASPTIHRSKLFGGQKTAEEIHQQYAFPPTARCLCGRRPMTRAIVMMELKEAMKNPTIQSLAEMAPLEFMEFLQKNTVQIKTTDGKGTTPYFRVSVVYACKSCTPAMERQMAKSPSHCIVEINRGPGTDRIISS